MQKPWNSQLAMVLLVSCSGVQGHSQAPSDPSAAGGVYNGPPPATPGTEPTQPPPSTPRSAPENPAYPTSPGSVTSDNTSSAESQNGLVLARADAVQVLPGSGGWSASGGNSGSGATGGIVVGGASATGGFPMGGFPMGGSGTVRASGGAIGIGHALVRSGY